MAKANVTQLDSLIRTKARVEYYALVDEQVKAAHKACTAGWSGHWDQRVETALTELKAALKEAHTERYQQQAVERFLKQHEQFAESLNSLGVPSDEH